MITPPYSSPLNVIEHVWSAYKHMWAKFISTHTGKYNSTNMERDMLEVAELVGQRLSPAILHSADRYFQMVDTGILV